MFEKMTLRLAPAMAVLNRGRTLAAPATKQLPSAAAPRPVDARQTVRPAPVPGQVRRPAPPQAPMPSKPENDDDSPAGFGGGSPEGARGAPPEARKFGAPRSPAGRRPAPDGPPPAATRPEVSEAAEEAAEPVVTLHATVSQAPGALVVQPDRTPAGRGRRLVATEEQVRDFLEFTGEVLSVQNGPLQTTDIQRTGAAVLVDTGEDGSGDPNSVVLLVHKGNPMGPAQAEVRQAIRRMNLRIAREYLVEFETIRKVHEAADQRTPGKERTTRGRGNEQLQAMQHEVLNLIAEAASRRCSDIHVTVGRYEAVIRMRCDGVMERVREVQASWAAELLASAFNMADASDASYRNLDYQGARISEIRTPLPKGVQSIRLQFNPLPNGGRYLIARLLYATSAADSGGDVNTLGYGWSHVDQINDMRRKPFGINVICGPTGSGKSTTLQRALTALMREKRNQINVITIEDPPEYVIDGAAQLPVTNASTDEERKEKFRAAIAASLRSDPDVIMIGEIRDAASSGLAFAAAMTGHQVWASLHANDAISILDRFLDQGVEPYKLSDHTLITGLIGQRLIRSVCPRCAIEYGDAHKRGLIEDYIAVECERVAGGKLDEIRVANPSPPKECGCRGGYKGRQVIAETIVPDLEFMKHVRKGNKEDAVAYWIEELNGLTMLEHAGQKMMRGLCDPRDVADKAGDLKGIRDIRFDRVFGDLFAEAPREKQ